MQNINILDPNLGATHPTLVPWVQGMKNAGYSNEQIQMYFRQQMTAHMQGQQATQQQAAPQPISKHSIKLTMQNINNINILDPNLGATHPTLVPWVQEMKNAAYSNEQIQVYFRQLLAAHMQGQPPPPPPQQQLIQNHSVHPPSPIDNTGEIAQFASKSPKNGKRIKRKRKLSELVDVENGSLAHAKKIKLTNYKQENAALRQENEILKKRIDAMENNNLHPMNFDELNQLKIKMQNKIKLIEEAEKQLIDNTYKCVACMDNAKNISFADGCTHIALCDKCEASLECKLCPLCQTPYTNVKKINF